MANVKISEMPTTSSLNESDNFEISQETSSQTFVSAKTSLLTIANKIASAINFTSALSTNSKTLTGAINEAAGTFVSGTLTAGSTSITLSSNSITSNSRLDPYTSVYGVNPTNMSATTGSVTLTFEAQSNDITVGVEVK